MVSLATPDLALEYTAWLRERISSRDQGGTQVLSTPFLDPFNDGIRVFLEPSGGEFLLHDDGNTFDNLSDLGVKIEDSERKQILIQRAVAGCGVRFQNGRLEITATHTNLAQRLHFLITSILRLNDLWMSSVSHRWVDFFELVAEFFDQHDVLYTPNVSIPGKTVDHQMDFVIPLPKRKERLIKLIGAPTPQTAKIISFSWMELRDARPDAERVVILNDVRPPDPLETADEEEQRRVSEQTVSILRGYSSAVYRWSERDAASFSRLWLPS
jgi:hypothetical protein